MPVSAYLVDTSAWLFALKKDYLPELKDRIDDLLREDAIITTGIVLLELLSGTKTKKEFHRLKTRLDSLGTVQTDNGVWHKACELGFELRRKGITVPATDILIVACALEVGSVILHADTHFDLISKHVPIGVESYVKAVSRAIK